MFRDMQCPKCFNVIETHSCKFCGIKDVFHSDERIVKQEVYNGYFVSTVHTVIDHDMTGEGSLWFETMVFKGEKVSSDTVYVKRCQYPDEAVLQHEEAKMIIDKGLNHE
jgi:hypothetical protein